MSRTQRGGYFRLYRDPHQGWIFGVCAGIADYAGFSAVAVRVLTLAGLVFFTLPTLIGYFALAFLLQRRPETLYRDEEEARFWTRARTEPRATVGELARRIRGLDERMRAAEAHVTSSSYRLRRQFDDLER